MQSVSVFLHITKNVRLVFGRGLFASPPPPSFGSPEKVHPE